MGGLRMVRVHVSRYHQWVQSRMGESRDDTKDTALAVAVATPTTCWESLINCCWGVWEAVTMIC